MRLQFLMVGVAVVVLFAPVRSAVATAYTFTTVTVPGATDIELNGINDSGEIVGSFVMNRVQRPFSEKNGVVTPITPPTADNAIASGINNSGVIVGFSATGNSFNGFIDVNGSVTPFNFANSTSSILSGVADNGIVVGSFRQDGVFKGIIGPFPFELPGAINTLVNGVNSKLEMVGAFDSGANFRGFFLDHFGGTFTTIDVPGARFTMANGINAAGEIVGTFDDATGDHGFIDNGGVLSTLDVPGAIDTQANGINGLGQIVGTFVDSNGDFSGFIATPVSDVPEPATLVLFGTAVLLGFRVRGGKVSWDRDLARHDRLPSADPRKGEKRLRTAIRLPSARLRMRVPAWRANLAAEVAMAPLPAPSP